MFQGRLLIVPDRFVEKFEKEGPKPKSKPKHVRDLGPVDCFIALTKKQPHRTRGLPGDVETPERSTPRVFGARRTAPSGVPGKARAHTHTPATAPRRVETTPPPEQPRPAPSGERKDAASEIKEVFYENKYDDDAASESEEEDVSEQTPVQIPPAPTDPFRGKLARWAQEVAEVTGGIVTSGRNVITELSQAKNNEEWLSFTNVVTKMFQYEQLGAPLAARLTVALKEVVRRESIKPLLLELGSMWYIVYTERDMDETVHLADLLQGVARGNRFGVFKGHVLAFFLDPENMLYLFSNMKYIASPGVSATFERLALLLDKLRKMVQDEKKHVDAINSLSALLEDGYKKLDAGLGIPQDIEEAFSDIASTRFSPITLSRFSPGTLISQAGEALGGIKESIDHIESKKAALVRDIDGYCADIERTIVTVTGASAKMVAVVENRRIYSTEYEQNESRQKCDAATEMKNNLHALLFTTSDKSERYLATAKKFATMMENGISAFRQSHDYYQRVATRIREGFFLEDGDIEQARRMFVADMEAFQKNHKAGEAASYLSMFPVLSKEYPGLFVSTDSSAAASADGDATGHSDSAARPDDVADKGQVDQPALSTAGAIDELFEEFSGALKKQYKFARYDPKEFKLDPASYVPSAFTGENIDNLLSLLKLILDCFSKAKFLAPSAATLSEKEKKEQLHKFQETLRKRGLFVIFVLQEGVDDQMVQSAKNKLGADKLSEEKVIDEIINAVKNDAKRTPDDNVPEGKRDYVEDAWQALWGAVDNDGKPV